jgi:WD40 repeat protein
LQLSKGRLFFDNKVELNGMAYNKLSTLSTTTFDNYGGSSSYIVATAWSPNEKYLAIGGNGPTSGNELWLYAFTGTTLSLLDSKNYGNEIDSLSWSPDGKYLAVGGDNGTTDLTIYSFDGSTLTSVTTQEYGSNVYGISWSPDGRYLAICGLLASKFGGTASTDEIQVYCFDGKSLVPVTSQSYGNDRYVRSVSWSPDGIYLAVGGVAPSSDDTGFTYDQIRIYRFNGSALTAVTSQPYRTSYSSSVVHSVSWSPNGQYLVIGGYAPAAIGGFSNSDVLRLYSFNGSTLTPVTSKNYGLTVRSISWSPDGRYVAVGGNSPSDNNEIQVYRFDRSLLTSITSQDYGTSGVVYAVSFSQSGKYLAIGGKYASNNNELWIDTCQYINDTSEPANPITFGNSSLGSTYDLDVNILSGARVEITGKVTHDPA